MDVEGRPDRFVSGSEVTQKRDPPDIGLSGCVLLEGRPDRFASGSRSRGSVTLQVLGCPGVFFWRDALPRVQVTQTPHGRGKSVTLQVLGCPDVFFWRDALPRVPGHAEA